MNVKFASAIAFVTSLGCGRAPEDHVTTTVPPGRTSVAPTTDTKSIAPASTVEGPSEAGERTPALGHKPIVSFEPNDLQTATGDTPLRAWIDFGGEPVSEKLLTQIASLIVLKELGTGAHVPFRTTSYNPPEIAPPVEGKKGEAPVNSSEPADRRAYVQIAPLKKLAPGWHYIGLAADVPDVVAAPWAESPLTAERIGARFNPASDPVLAKMVFCSKEPGTVKVIAEFSENVSTDAASVERAFRVAPPSGACKVLARDTTRWVEFLCGSALGGLWNAQLSPGLKTIPGNNVRTLTGADSGTWSITVDQLREVDDSCRVWKP